MLAFQGCNIPDDIIAIHKELDALGEEDKEIATRIKVVRESINALQAIVDVLQSGYYIKSVIPFTDEDGRTGNICSFTNGGEIRVYDGVDASDGSVPRIGAQQEPNGIWYWTIDGSLIYDGMGALIPISNKPGSGETIKEPDDMIPQLTIQGGYWFISFDYGASWKQLGQASGKDGLDGEDAPDKILSIDQTSPDFLAFVLMDGTTLSVPYYKEIRIHFDMDDMDIPIGERETIRIDYSLTAADGGTYVSVSTDGFYTAVSKQTSELEGYILVTCPRGYSDGFINVVVYTKTGVSDMKVINFCEKRMSFSEGCEFDVPIEGGTVRVPFVTNFDFRVEVDSKSDDWLAVNDTRAAVEKSGEIAITALENKGMARSGIVYVYSDNGVEPFASIIIDQESPNCKADNGSYVISYEGGTVLSNITTKLGVSLDIPSDGWVRGEVIDRGNNEYVAAFTVDPNPGNEPREMIIMVNSKSGKTPLTKILLVQRGRNNDLEMAMIFIVNPNYSNDFTAFLPINVDSHYKWFGKSIPSDLDCFIDWGDGTPGEHISVSDKRWELPEDQRAIRHHYEGLEVGRKFEVVVTGTLPSLDARNIPKSFRSSVTEVRQWGKLGLRNMDYAFEGFIGLETLHPDETGAFAEVSSFINAFHDCPRLKTVSEHLFDYAAKATDFGGLFNNCQSLAVIPERLFSNCSSALSFSTAFRDCKALASIPENLFAGCTLVTDMSQVFTNCFSVVSIPEGLFKCCPKIWNCDSAFKGCRSVREIPAKLFENNGEIRTFAQTFKGLAIDKLPEHLFDNCPNVQSFNGTFLSCRLLEKVPYSVFDNQRKVLSFESTFRECALWKESPYTILSDGTKVHLYERKDHPDDFVTPIDYTSCFRDNNNLPDWDSIPEAWREGY